MFIHWFLRGKNTHTLTFATISGIYSRNVCNFIAITRLFLWRHLHSKFILKLYYHVSLLAGPIIFWFNNFYKEGLSLWESFLVYLFVISISWDFFYRPTSKSQSTPVTSTKQSAIMQVSFWKENDRLCIIISYWSCGFNHFWLYLRFLESFLIFYL